MWPFQNVPVEQWGLVMYLLTFYVIVGSAESMLSLLGWVCESGTDV